MTREEVIRDLKYMAMCYAELHKVDGEYKARMRTVGMFCSAMCLTSSMLGMIDIGNEIIGSIGPIISIGVLITTRYEEMRINRKMKTSLRCRQECLELVNGI